MLVKLAQSVERLYVVFEAYPLNPKMKGSPVYGQLDQWNRELAQKPLRQLTSDNLNRFTGKAMSTWGTVEDYKHFLPRIFDLTARYDTPYEIRIAFSKLVYGEWQKWDLTERHALLGFLSALFENLLHDNSSKAERHFTDYFSALFAIYPNPQRLLDRWETIETPAAYRHLAAFILSEGPMLIEKGKFGFDKHNAKSVELLKKWLFRPEMVKRIEMAYFNYEKEDFAENLSEADRLLRHYRSS